MQKQKQKKQLKAKDVCAWRSDCAAFREGVLIRRVLGWLRLEMGWRSPGCTHTAECWVDSLAARWATTIRWLPMRFCEEWPNLQGLPSFFGSVALIGPLIHYSSLFDCPSIRPIFDQLSKALKGSHLTYHWAKEEFNLNKLPVHCEARDFPIKRAF